MGARATAAAQTARDMAARGAVGKPAAIRAAVTGGSGVAMGDAAETMTASAEVELAVVDVGEQLRLEEVGGPLEVGGLLEMGGPRAEEEETATMTRTGLAAGLAAQLEMPVGVAVAKATKAETAALRESVVRVAVGLVEKARSARATREAVAPAAGVATREAVASAAGAAGTATREAVALAAGAELGASSRARIGATGEAHRRPREAASAARPAATAHSAPQYDGRQ